MSERTRAALYRDDPEVVGVRLDLEGLRGIVARAEDGKATDDHVVLALVIALEDARDMIEQARSATGGISHSIDRLVDLAVEIGGLRARLVELEHLADRALARWREHQISDVDYSEVELGEIDRWSAVLARGRASEPSPPVADASSGQRS